MLQNIKKRQEGFTIIEVMIVLAIAGLIMLMVFLAVPALQRTSRNTQAKNAAAALLATINEFQNNNDGAQPATVTVANGVITVAGVGFQTATGKMQGGYIVTPAATIPATAGTFNYGLGQKCVGNTAMAAAPRSVAIGFSIETNSGVVSQCVEG